MNLNESEIIDLIKNAGIPSSAYSLYGSDGHDILGVDHQKDKFNLYYCERGLRRILKTFDSIEEAYGILYKMLIEGFSRPVKDTNNNKVYLRCTACNQELRLPSENNKPIRIKCPKCNSTFIINFSAMIHPMNPISAADKE